MDTESSKTGRVVMRPGWEHLLFLHWRADPEQIQAMLPPGLEVDTFDGSAWVGLVPFTMSRVCPNWAPSLGSGALHRRCYNFHETNVRTYVRHRGPNGVHSGVWFFSLDAANLPAVIAARRWYKLPYFHARMSLQAGDGEVHYASRRLWPRPLPATCAISARMSEEVFSAEAGSLEHFLVERYLLYSFAAGRLWRGRVVHPPYPLQAAEVARCEENLVAAAGISRPDAAPHVLYSRGVEVEIQQLECADG